MLIESEVIDGPAAFSTGSSDERQQVRVLGDVVDQRRSPVDRREVVLALDRDVARGEAPGPARRCRPC